MHITIENVVFKGKLYPFDAVVYDTGDGMEGLFVRDNAADEVKREASGNTVSSTTISTGSLYGLVNTAANAGINAAKNIGSSRAKRQKVNLPANYQLLIKLKQ